MRRFQVVVLLALYAASVAAPSRPATAAGARTVVFAAAGDHGANATTAKSLSKLNASGADFYLAIGDLDYGQVRSPKAWCDYVRSHLPALGPSFPFELLAGNHEEDTISEHASCLQDHLGAKLGPSKQYATEYYFDYPASAPLVRVLMLSPGLVINNVAYKYSAGSTRYNWVAATVDGARAAGIPWVVAGMHMPCLGSGSCHAGPDLMNLLVRKKVDLIIQGHDHTYKRGKQLALGAACPSIAGSYDADCVADNGSDGLYTKGAGTVVVINGSFGKGGSSSAKGYFAVSGGGNGFTRFDLTADRLDAQFVNSTSSFQDSYSIQR